MTLGFAYTLVSLFAILLVGFIVYFHNRKSVTHLLFLLMALSTVFWGIANYNSTISPNEILNIRLVLFFAAPHIVLFLMFLLNFPRERFTISTWLTLLLIGEIALLMGLAISPYVFTGVVAGGALPTPQPGAAMPIFAGSILLTLFASLYVMARKYAEATQEYKRRWFFMLFGTLLSYALLILTNFVLVVFYGNTDFVVFAPLFMLPTFAGMAIAVLRYHLFNIKVVSAELLTFTVLFISLTDVLLTDTPGKLAVRLTMFLLFLIFGILLIRGVVKEVKQREQIQQLATDLERANVRLRELDKMKTEFVSIASHQMSNPLISVIEYSEALLKKTYGPLSQKVEDTVRHIRDTSVVMLRAVNDFLDISRIEQGRMQYSMSTFDICSMLRDIVEKQRPLAEKMHLELKLQLPKQAVCDLKADATKLQQVFLNIIDNAIKYTPDGSIVVTFERDDEANVARVAVKDTGIGMSEETKRNLFGKFVRAPSAKQMNQRGTGLGLHVAKQMVKGHHGKIWAESEGEGKGSTFYIEVPLSK